MEFTIVQIKLFVDNIKEFLANIKCTDTYQDKPEHQKTNPNPCSVCFTNLKHGFVNFYA